MTTRPLTPMQLTNLSLASRGFISTSSLNSIPSLVKRGLVEDLGLYDREKHCKRYGSGRYKVTAKGFLTLKKAQRV